MEKFIPVEKLSKKEQQKKNAARRGSWYGLNPVTRKPESSKAYNRRKAQKWSDDSGSVPFVISVRRSSAAVFFDYSPADFEHLINLGDLFECPESPLVRAGRKRGIENIVRPNTQMILQDDIGKV